MPTLGSRRAILAADWRTLLSAPWVSCVGAILLVGVKSALQGLPALSSRLGDTDDATRLYEVRRLMDGTSWFDMSLPRIGGETPLISHWSRLIDLPLMLLLKVFGLFLSTENAEIATRFVWPLLVLFAFFCIMYRAAVRQNGVTAGRLLLVIGLMSMVGQYQFVVGRIDHHNVMITCAIGGLLLLIGARQDPREGCFAGCLIGLSLAIGYEPLVLVMPAMAAAALLAIIDLAWLSGVRNALVGMAGFLAAAFVVTVSPPLWLVARCDSLSLNLVLLAACGAAGVALIDVAGRQWPLTKRIIALVGTGVVGSVVFGSLETRCLYGPMGQVNPAIKPIWLDHVSETFTIYAFGLGQPTAVSIYVGTIAIGIWAAVLRWRRLQTAESSVLLALMLVVPAVAWMVRLMPYAVWIAVFCTALWLADLRPGRRLTVLSRQLLGLIAAAEGARGFAAALILGLIGAPANAAKQATLIDSAQCMTTPAIRALAMLPKGTFVGSIDFGPYIVALTQHDVLAAPYHRIDRAIIANQAILGTDPIAAQKLIDDAHADYLILCIPEIDAAPSKIEPTQNAGLETQLRAGRHIAYLSPVTIKGEIPELKVWRVVR